MTRPLSRIAPFTGPLLIALALPLLAGMLASHATMPYIPTWYATLEKPVLTPPNALFAPVWTMLYILMGISSFLVWRTPKTPQRRRALQVYAVQLALNTLWSFSFFALQNPLAGLVNIIALWVVLVLMLGAFMRVHRCAAWLQIPGFLWVSFAMWLNAAIWWLNT